MERRISREWGSELDWTLLVPAAQGQATFSENIALAFLRYLAYFNVDNPNYQLSGFGFSVPSFWRMVQTSIPHVATDLDLGRFENRGGKPLLWHGWSDHHITPQSTLQYCEAMRKTMGAEAVERFAWPPGSATARAGWGRTASTS